MAMDQHDEFRVCRDEVKHEYGVLSSRLTSYITSQSFLMSAYAVAMNNASPDWGPQFRIAFPVLLAVVGVILSFRAHPGIVAVCNIIQAWHVRQDDLFSRYSDIEEYGVLRNRGKDNEKNLRFAQGATWIFGISWVLMGGLAVWMNQIHAPVRH